MSESRTFEIEVEETIQPHTKNMRIADLLPPTSRVTRRYFLSAVISWKQGEKITPQRLRKTKANLKKFLEMDDENIKVISIRTERKVK